METVKKVLTDAYILKPKVFQDERGGFFESFNKGVFDSLTGTNISFVQDNQSNSSKGTLRGLHFQCGKAAQSKLVRVVKGSVYDVAVDLRPQSPTFKQWHAVELNEHNHLQFFIPRGFANAFLALEDETIFQYKVDNFYSSKHDGGVFWNDPELAADWPDTLIELSNKDKELPQLSQLNPNKLW